MHKNKKSKLRAASALLLSTMLLFSGGPPQTHLTSYIYATDTSDLNNTGTNVPEMDQAVNSDIIEAGTYDKLDKGEQVHQSSGQGTPVELLSWRSVEDGSSNLSKAGIYVAQDDTFLYIYTTAKRSTNSTGYRTIGFNVHTDKKQGEGIYQLQNRLQLRIKYGDTSDSIAVGTAYYNQGHKVYPNGLDLNFEKKSVSTSYYEDDTYGSLIGTCYRVEYGAFAALLGINANVTDTVYLSAINAFSVNGHWDTSVYWSKSATQARASALGFSSQAINSDIPKLYDIPVKLKKPSYHVNFIDTTTGKKLLYDSLTLQQASNNLSTYNSIYYTLNNLDQPLTLPENWHLTSYGEQLNSSNTKFVYNNAVLLSTLYNEADSDYSGYGSYVHKRLAGGIKEPDCYVLSEDLQNTVSNAGINMLNKEYESNYTLAGTTISGSTISMFNSNTYSYNVGEETNSLNVFILNPNVSIELYIFVTPITGVVETYLPIQCINGKTGELLGKIEVPYSNLISEARKVEPADEPYNLDSNWTPANARDSSQHEVCTYGDIPISLTDEIKLTSGTYYFEGFELYNDYSADTQDIWTDAITKGVQQASASSSAYIGTLVTEDLSFNLPTRIKSLRRGWILPEKTQAGSDIPAYTLDVSLDYPTNKSGEQPQPVYRAIYTPEKQIPILYYDSHTGSLIGEDFTLPSTSINVKSEIQFDGKPYTLVNSSYRVNTTRQEDIDGTLNNTPVMNTRDKGMTSTATVQIPQETLDTIEDLVVRVECIYKEQIDEILDSLDKVYYTIPAQYLTKPFTYSKDLSAHVEELEPPETTKHKKSTDSGYHTCTHSFSYKWFEHKFDWNDSIDEVVTPLTGYLFVDHKPNGLTSLAPMEYEKNSFNISGNFDLKWTTHRVSVDGVAPIFASYMSSMNAKALSYLNNHSMQDLAQQGLTPNSKYNGSGGTKGATFSIKAGNDNTPHGRKWELYRQCTYCSSGLQSSGVAGEAEYTRGKVQAIINAEPSLVASPLDNSADKFEVIGEPTDNLLTIYSTNKNTHGIKFYPTYKMFMGDGSDAWVLGRQQRTLNAVNVAQIEVLNTTPVATVQTTWSRDKQDSNQLVMKGGYTWNTFSQTPMQLKITTYTVVPKSGWTATADTDRTNLLNTHNNLVNQFNVTDNYKIFSNLPEAYQDNYPAEWKITNPYKTAAENVLKCRIPNPSNVTIVKSDTTSTILSLDSVDNLFQGKVDNVARLNSQLESKSWYVEHFSGFEVVKQVTTLNISYKNTSAVNYIRNGGETANDLARNVRNIQGHRFGIEFGYYNSSVGYMGNTLAIEKLTKPFTFNVRGTVYDDRS